MRLQLNIEQYEYMSGPNDGAGVKLLVHQPHDVPLVKDHGLAVPAGMHAFVALKIVEVSNAFNKLCGRSAWIFKMQQDILDLVLNITLDNESIVFWDRDIWGNILKEYGVILEVSTRPICFS